MLLLLRGTLSVARLESVYEDPTHVFLVMELCRGGEVVGRHSFYTEPEAASILRAVLQTIAQCNAHGIIHRDIKPENFLLLSKSKDAPVKAIDFGLAAFFTPDALPITAAHPSGTLWYMSPEATQATWYPNSDVWSAGCMAAFLLIGQVPFGDRVTPEDPSPARVFQSICNDPIDFGGPKWAKLSPLAVDFVRFLLVKDPAQRPTATQALAHPFLMAGAGAAAAAAAAAASHSLHHTLVQRLQRFALHGVFKRALLEHIAADFLSRRHSWTGASEASPARLNALLDSLDADSDGKVERADLQVALRHMGFRLDENESAELFDAVDVERRGSVAKAELSASLMDWEVVQQEHSDEWVAAARRVFQELDRGGKGVLSAADIAALFTGQLEDYEVEAVVHEAMMEALGAAAMASAEEAAAAVAAGQPACPRSYSIDFPHLLHLLEAGTAMEDLQLFDDRLATKGSRQNFSIGQLDEAILAARRVSGGNGGSVGESSAKKRMRRVLSLKCLT